MYLLTTACMACWTGIFSFFLAWDWYGHCGQEYLQLVKQERIVGVPPLLVHCQSLAILASLTVLSNIHWTNGSLTISGASPDYIGLASLGGALRSMVLKSSLFILTSAQLGLHGVWSERAWAVQKKVNFDGINFGWIPMGQHKTDLLSHDEYCKGRKDNGEVELETMVKTFYQNVINNTCNSIEQIMRTKVVNVTSPEWPRLWQEAIEEMEEQLRQNGPWPAWDPIIKGNTTLDLQHRWLQMYTLTPAAIPPMSEDQVGISHILSSLFTTIASPIAISPCKSVIDLTSPIAHASGSN
ncbi:hypothetical protein HD554DRAFT_2041120 [Boletus coccyginus]|nr:hypothetical protein HD554DRAFT_2041120 [Boletus coccyginus]